MSNFNTLHSKLAALSTAQKLTLLGALLAVVLFSTLLAMEKAEASVAMDGLSLYEASFDYRRYFSPNRDPLFVNSEKKDGIAMNLKVDFLTAFCWDTTMHGESDSAQYHLVGLKTKLCFRPIPSIDLNYMHHSQHILDGSYPYQKFPVEDSVGITLYLAGGPGRKALFQ